MAGTVPVTMSISLGSYANGCVGQPDGSYANLPGLIARAAVRRLTVAEQRAVTGTARWRALDGVRLGRTEMAYSACVPISRS